jgi:hypothetical protein
MSQAMPSSRPGRGQSVDVLSDRVDNAKSSVAHTRPTFCPPQSGETPAATPVRPTDLTRYACLADCEIKNPNGAASSTITMWHKSN